jgi:uncharacterized protein (DUF1778 family)
MSDITHGKAAPEAVATETDEILKVSERDFKRILELLEHPPLPNARLRAAIAALPNKV